MSVMYHTFLAILETFIVFGIGAWLMHRKYLDNNGVNQLSRLTLDVLFPLLTISAITRNFDASQLLEMWQLPVLGFLIMLFGGLLGLFLKRFMRHKTPARSAMFQHFCAANNYLFLPLIVLDNLWGEKYVGMLLVMNIGTTIGFWTVGVAAFGGASVRDTVRNIFSVNLYAVLLALALVAFRIPLPKVADWVCASLGNAAVPLVLIGIGAAIYNSAGRLAHHLYDVFYLSLVRLVLLPVAVILLLKLLPIPEDVFRVLAVVALMPVSSSSVLIARRYGGDMDLAGQSIVVTTLLSIVSAPLLLTILV